MAATSSRLSRRISTPAAWYSSMPLVNDFGLKDAAWLQRRYVDCGSVHRSDRRRGGLQGPGGAHGPGGGGIPRRQPRTLRRYPEPADQEWLRRRHLDENASALTIATELGCTTSRCGAPGLPPASTGTAGNAAVDATRGWPTGRGCGSATSSKASALRTSPPSWDAIPRRCGPRSEQPASPASAGPSSSWPIISGC